MTLRERIARAIYAEEGNQWDIQADEAEIPRIENCDYDDCSKQEKRAYEAYAQAALEAIVEGADIDAGRLAYNAAVNGQRGISCDQVRSIIKAAIAER